MKRTLLVCNLKADMPTVEEARARLFRRIDSARDEGYKLMKIVHGYGSTGVGGKIRPAVARSLARLQREGAVRSFVPGERWRKSDPVARRLLNDYPWLASDIDLGRGNKGIAIVELGTVPRAAKRKSSRRGRAPAEPRTPGPDAAEVEELLKTDPDRLYDRYTQPHQVRRHKPDA